LGWGTDNQQTAPKIAVAFSSKIIKQSPPKTSKTPMATTGKLELIIKINELPKANAAKDG
jgi:hypothetical protein